MNKKIGFLVVIILAVFTFGSCKYLKSKFSKKQEIAATDSTGTDGESNYSDGSSSSSDVSSTASADSSAVASSTTITNASSADNGSTSSSSSTSSNNNSSPNENTNGKEKIKSSSSTNNSPAIAAAPASKKTVADIDAEAKSKGGKRRVSTSIYDGINDQEERMVVRKAEGYNDYYYVDDYNGSNAEYEKHYKLASHIDGSKDYVVPAAGSPKPAEVKEVKPTPSPVADQPIIETPKAEEKKKGSGSHIGDTPPTAKDKTKTTGSSANDKPKSASDIIKKK